MPDLRGALDDLALIRSQLARSSEFQGFGPTTLILTGVLALALAATQSVWIKSPTTHAMEFIELWYAAAAFSILVIGVESFLRSQRVHGSLALPLLQQAARHFCPALVAGGLLTVALMRSNPSAAWLLPGLWEIAFSLGAFAMAPMLPRPMFAVGVWYLLCGLVCIQRGPEGALSGWTMGIPFGVGQFMVALILILRERLEPESE